MSDVEASERALDLDDLRDRTRWQALLAGVVLAVGVVLLVAFLVAAAYLGERTSGVTHDVAVDGVVTSAAEATPYRPAFVYVRYDFGGRSHVTPAYLGDGPAPYEKGQLLRAYVDPDDLSYLLLDPPPKDPPGSDLLVTVALLGGLALTAIGGLRLWDAIRLRRVLASTAWAPARIRIRTVGTGRATRSVALLSVDGEGGPAHLLELLHRMRPTIPASDVAVDVAGDPRRRVVIRTDDEALVTAKRVRARWMDRRWRPALERPDDRPLEVPRAGEPPRRNGIRR